MRKTGALQQRPPEDQLSSAGLVRLLLFPFSYSDDRFYREQMARKAKTANEDQHSQVLVSPYYCLSINKAKEGQKPRPWAKPSVGALLGPRFQQAGPGHAHPSISSS